MILLMYLLAGCGKPDVVPPATPTVDAMPAQPVEDVASPEGRCGEAFDHMTAVSERELESLPPDQQKMAREIAKKKEAGEAERRAKFVVKCEEGAFDLDCIFKAQDTMSYIPCMMPKKEPASD